MKIHYNAKDVYSQYSTEGYYTDVDKFLEYILLLNGDRLGNHNVWAWSDINVELNDFNEENNILYSFEDAIRFATDYVQNKGKYCMLYNVEEHNVIYEFINADTENDNFNKIK